MEETLKKQAAEILGAVRTTGPLRHGAFSPPFGHGHLDNGQVSSHYRAHYL
jgi:hypothetical protein